MPPELGQSRGRNRRKNNGLTCNERIPERPSRGQIGAEVMVGMPMFIGSLGENAGVTCDGPMPAMSSPGQNCAELMVRRAAFVESLGEGEGLTCAGPMAERPTFTWSFGKNDRLTKISRGWKGMGLYEITVDSGAEKSAWPAGWLLEGPMYRAEVGRRHPPGGAHYGRKLVKFRRSEGGNRVMSLSFEGTDVTDPVVAVRPIVDRCNDVHFIKTGGWIGNKVGGKNIQLAKKAACHRFQLACVSDLVFGVAGGSAVGPEGERGGGDDEERGSRGAEDPGDWGALGSGTRTTRTHPRLVSHLVPGVHHGARVARRTSMAAAGEEFPVCRRSRWTSPCRGASTDSV